MSSTSPLSESPARWLSAQLRRVAPSPPALALVDLRPAEDYRRGHLRGATNLPWTEFVPRDFELPARGAHLCVLGTAATLSSALPYLAKRGYPVDRALCLDGPAGPPGPLDPRYSPEPPEPRGPQDAPAAARPDRELERLDLADPELRDLLECGPQSRRLWKACPFLAEHIATIEQQLARPVSECLAVDLASGNGRDGVFLAARGWGVAAVDYNTSSLARALLLAHNERVPFRAICADLEADPASPVSPAAPEPCDGESKGAGREFSSLVMDAAESALLVPFEKAVERLTLGEVFALRADLVHVARYLHRPLFPLIRDMIRPGGFVVYHTFMRGAEKYGKPRKDRFLLEHEELLSVFAGWHVVHYAESPISPADQDPRPAAFLVARKPA